MLAMLVLVTAQYSTQDTGSMFPSQIQAAFTFIMTAYWQFLTADWPVLVKPKYHRTETKEVKDIQHVKPYVLEHLGYIPVFFFLVELVGKDEYPGHIVVLRRVY